jgi:hypothetical protein
MRRVFSSKFSVFCGGRRVPLVDKMDSEIIRIPGFGRYRKPTVGIGRLGNLRMMNFDFRMGNGTTKYAKYSKGGMGRFQSRQGLKGKAAVGLKGYGGEGVGIGTEVAVVRRMVCRRIWFW